MSRHVSFTLTPEQLAEIEQAINYSPRPEVRQRAIAIRLLHLGHHPEQVSLMVAITANTIWTWHRRWRENGVAGLQDQPRSGRRRKATPEYQQLLHATLETEPIVHGYDFTVWTMARLRTHLHDKTGIDLSRARFSALMSELGYVYRRPKRDLSSKQDVSAKQQAAALIEELKKAPSRGLAHVSLWTKHP